MSDFARGVNQVLMFVGAVVFIAGFWLALNNYLKVQAVEAMGSLGQAALQERYEEAAQNVLLFGTASAGGFITCIVFGFGLIEETLKNLTSD